VVTNLQDEANQFVAGQTARYQTPPVTGGSSTSFAPTSLLPGSRSVGLQDTGANAGGAGAYWARRGLDTVKSDVDRINSEFNARLASFQADNAAQANQLSTNGGLGNVTYGDINAAGKAWKSDGTLSDSRNSLLANASSYLGSKYVLGGTTKQGIDCSGLVMAVYNKLGFKVSQHDATWQGKNIPGVRTSVKNLRPGDIVAWKDGSHIAIYAGNGEIIEAANTRVGTVRRKLWASANDVVGIAVRLPGESTGIGTAPAGTTVKRQTETASGRGLA
jgi:cell wall-associated NlpC family hydrolase